MRRRGIRVGRKRVERLMREAGLKARSFRQYRRLAGLHRYFNSIENRRLELPAPSAINRQWVADLTYLKVGKRWRYLATVMDLYSRRIVGWSLGKAKNSRLTIRALLRAIRNRQPPPGLVFHTDRGAEYRAYDVQRVLEQHQMIPSMNRPYRSVDNAEMESFFKSLKADLIRGRQWRNLAALRADLSSYINHFYNTQGLHSSLGYNTPVEYESLAQ